MATATAPPTATPTSSEADVQAPPRRRRPRHIAAGVALIAVCGLGGAWLATTLSDTESVITVAEPVPRGQPIPGSALTTTQVNASDGLITIDGAQLEEYVGQRAAVDLNPGTTLTPEAVTSTMVPTGQNSLVALALPSTRLPNEPLLPGDAVDVVLTPEDTALADEPQTTRGTVSAIGQPDASDTVVVDLLVESEDAATLTAQAAAGQVGIVLAPRDANTEGAQ